MLDYDVIIIGAGPAGSTAAANLDADKRVLIVDKRCFSDQTRLRDLEKSCGGMLDKRAQKALAAQQIPLPADVLVSPQVFILRGIDLDNKGHERYYQRQYVNIDRVKFDRFLLERALKRPNVAMAEETRAAAFAEKADCVEVTLRGRGGVRKVTAGAVIGADGAGSWLRRRVDKNFGKKPLKRYASIQEWYEADETAASYTAVFDKRVTDYYSWVIPENNQIIIGSALPADARARERFELYKQDLRDLGFDLSRKVKSRGAIILRPASLGSVCPGKDRIFLTGEAAGLISPSTCEGISFALNSGLALAESLNAGESVKQYGRRLGALKRKIFFNSFKSPIMYSKVLRGLIFDLGLLSMKVK